MFDAEGNRIPRFDAKGRPISTLVALKIEPNPGAGLWRPHNCTLIEETSAKKFLTNQQTEPILTKSLLRVKDFLGKGVETMRSLMNCFGNLRTMSLSLLMAGVFVLAVVFGMIGQVDAQRTRYTIDDVMDKLIEVDKRLTVVETEVKRNRELIETVNANLTKQIETVNANLTKQIETVNANLTKQIEMVHANLGDRISATNTTMRWLFGLLVALFASILVFVFNIARNMRPPESSRAFRKEVREIAERERALEEKLQAEDRSVPKVLEALRQEVSALAERQKELEGKLTLAKVI